jgi:hypothetical protein
MYVCIYIYIIGWNAIKDFLYIFSVTIQGMLYIHIYIWRERVNVCMYIYIYIIGWNAIKDFLYIFSVTIQGMLYIHIYTER